MRFARKHRYRKNFYRCACLIIVFSVFLLVADAKIRPTVYTLAAGQARRLATVAINSAVEKELTKNPVNYSDIVKVSYAADGGVSCITTDILKMNLLKANITRAVDSLIKNTSNASVTVPFGSATGIALFAGAGPDIDVDLSFDGYSTSDFRNVFESVGINQTQHSVMLNVTANIIIILDGCSVQATLDTDFCVAQTIIVGTVPNVSAQLK